jgi:Chaperone of endosialidase
MNPLMQSKNTTILPVLIALMLGCFALTPQARAVCQQGCLTNNNTVLGDDALIDNTTGFNGTALGFGALSRNTTGVSNTAIGNGALNFNTSGVFNTATGAGALLSNTIGNFNTANGEDALYFNNTGNNNTANGVFALTNNHEGSNNTASGNSALLRNITGSNNIALGYLAGQNLTTGSDNIYIGNLGGSFHESRRIRIGRVGGHTDTFIAGISGGTVPDGIGVIVGANGKLGTVVSSARFKEAIKPMDKASEAILALRPVTFRYKHELDPEGIPQFGLVAEDVEKVNPDLVARDEQGKPYTVRYEAVNAMLLNEFLKEHRKVESLEKQLKAADAKQEEKISALTELVKAQGAQLQKVRAQLEASKPAPQVVLNDQ